MTARSAYVVSDDATRVDLDVVWEYLATEAYWSTRRSREDVEAQVAGAWRVVGAYDADFGFRAPHTDLMERPAPERGGAG